MSARCETQKKELCKHGKSRKQCRSCLIVVFLLCRNQITPHLTKDACRVIFSKLPSIIRLSFRRGICYELDQCGPSQNVRVPITRPPEKAICGTSFIDSKLPYVLYCSFEATRQGASGYWTCSAHAKRSTPNLTRRGTKAVSKGRLIQLTGLGINYIVDEPPDDECQTLKGPSEWAHFIASCLAQGLASAVQGNDQ